MSIIIHGLDISLNHGGVVQLKDGKLDNFFYYTDKASSAKASNVHGSRILYPTPKKESDKHIRSLIRYDWVCKWLKRVVINNKPNFAGLEDYAIGADQGAHYLGEIGGYTRRLLWILKVPFRLHDPIAIKMYVTHDATAKKDLVEEFVQTRWGVDFSKYNGVSGKSRQTSEDLCDAFGIAQLVWTEYLLRKGKIKLLSLPEKEIRVFNRATRAFPVNILGRGWIHK